MTRVKTPVVPVILLGLCAVLWTCSTHHGPPVKPDAPDGGDVEVVSDAGIDTRAPDLDAATPDLDAAEVDEVDPCACGDNQCGDLPGCPGVDCGLCGPGEFCKDNYCVEEGACGTPCPEDGKCLDGAVCVGFEDDAVCSTSCEEDGACTDCGADWSCVEQPGDPAPEFICVPPCDDIPDCGDSCGFLEDGCGTFAACGACAGANEICEDNLCVCEFEACDDACCAEGEVCADGACLPACDPPCETCFVCQEDGACAPMECDPGFHCENDGEKDLCVPGGDLCDPCGVTADCAPGLDCTGGACYDTDGGDATCDLCDDDGDGQLSEDYVIDDACGEGVCQDNNTPSSCDDGVETLCQPGEPLADTDTTCDNIDDDCDGVVDDDYVPDDTCGIGWCQVNNTPSSCDAGEESPCEPGQPLADDDTTCDGVDDDCDGVDDENYVPDDSCGTGWCLVNNTPSSCMEGVEIPCDPGPPAPADTSCNNVDDDCDGLTDDDYIANDSCGTGICQMGNTPSSCVEGFESPCEPGQPIGETDAACDGLDDDCDGSADEDYVPDASCGTGYCQLHNSPSTCVGSTETACVPAEPQEGPDDQCNYIDDDCDGETDEDADPPCATGTPVTGATVAFLPTLGTASGIVADNGNGTYASTVVDLTNPGKTGDVSAVCNGNISVPIDFEVTAGALTTVDLAVSRPEVCADDAALRACARVTDDLGAPAASDTAVLFTLDLDGEITAQSASSQGDGLFCAWITAPGGAFDGGASGTVQAKAAGVSSDVAALDAIALPAALNLGVGEVGLRLPLCARLAGSTFIAPVIVNTGDHELGSYNISCAFDGGSLTVLQVAKGAAASMGDPVPSIADGSVSFTAINAQVDGTAKGPAVEVALITFKVKETAGDGDAAAVNCEVQDLFNTNLVSISANPDVLVYDGDGQGTTGFVDAASPAIAGLFATLSDNALINMALVSGEASVAFVKVLGLWNDGVLTDVAQAPGTICEATDPGVGVAAGCAVTGTGAGVTTVTAVAGGFASETTLWVLGPQLPAQVSLSDANLRYIPHIDRLQEAQVEVVATFTDGDLFAFDLDVTAQSSFISMVPAVAQVDEDGVVTSVDNGASAIVAFGAFGDELGSANVQVEGGQNVSVTDIHVVVPATIKVTGLDPEEVPDALGEAAVEATVTNLFDSDGQQVQASVQLVLSDDEETGGGSRIDVTDWKDAEAEGAMSFGSSDGSVITVDEDGLVTAVGSGDAQVQATFENNSSGYTGQGDGAVEVQLPPPQSVDLNVADPRLALGAADTAHTILGLPTARQLQVIVHFVNGTSKDFTALSQTHYAVTGGFVTVTNLADCAGVPDCAPGRVETTGIGVGTALVTVTFPGTYLDVVSAQLEIEVVSHDQLVLKSVELHTPAGVEPAPEQTLSWVECVGTRQQARLIVEEVFTDGSVVDLTGHTDTTYGVYAIGTSVPDDTVVAADPLTDRVTAVGLGTVDIRAMNGTHESAPLAIKVDDVHMDIVDLDLFHAAGATLHGVRDVGTGQLDVTATFTDGTHMLLTGPDFIPGLLVFSSHANEHATVDATGLMTAKGNGPAAMTVDLADDADCEPAYDVVPGLGLQVNLLPVAGDVDMGFVNGLAFPDQAADAVFQIPVRVNTGGKVLGGIDLEIDYDQNVILAVDVEVGGDIPGAIFNGNLEATPGVIYLNASPSLAAPVSGSGVEVAVLTFQALKSGGPVITFIGGTVVEVVDAGGAVIGEATPKPIVAGAGLFDPPPGGVWGDANDDELFSIADVLFVQQIIVEPPLVIPNQTQVIQSDLFPDGVVASNDAFFASRGLARLVHFVEVVVTGTELAGQSEILVTVTDRDQMPVDENLLVRVELDTEANLDTIIFTGSHEFTASGVVTILDGQGDGEYETLVSGILQEEPDQEPIGVVVILDVLGPDGEVIQTTAFLETPLIDPAAEFKPIAYVADVCPPDCDGKVCGEDNGCGKPCIGSCEFANEICINGACVCGGVSCAGQACGADDGCGNPCVVPCPDAEETCTDTGCVCENDTCEGDCCAVEETCNEVPPGSGNMQCSDICTPDCDGKDCGADDGCFWFCDGLCPEVNQECNEDFVCVCEGDYCVDECCPADHVCLDGECCGVQTCEGEGWECGAHYVGCSTFVNCGSCGLYGVCDLDFQCDCEHEKCEGICCNPGETCHDGACTIVCIPDCTEKLCGEDDGCEGVCEGPCALSNQDCVDAGGGQWSCDCTYEECAGVCCDYGLVCDWQTGDCAPPCTPDCEGKLCGQADNCGSVCQGPCALEFQYCVSGACVCEGNGGFFCDGACCPFGEDCIAGVCVVVCPPVCAGKPCGADDECGGICLTGACPGDNEACQYGVCTCEFAFCGGTCCDEGDSCDGDLCCTPLTCEDYGAEECGEIWDGCSAYVSCGECGEFEECDDDFTCACQFHDSFCVDVCCDEHQDCVDDVCEDACVPICDGLLACGTADDCGGQCDGPCPGDAELCVLVATGPSVRECECQGTSCLGKACGDDDGCGGLCDGPCDGDNEVCAAGGCVCAGNDGDTCGVDAVCCPADWTCVAGVCKFECTPDCEDDLGQPLPCGTPDGCNGYCDGTCPGLNEVCNDTFICVCAGDFCDGACCAENHVCHLNSCCQVDTCEDLNAECGTHYIGCGSFASCGDCGLNGICNAEFQCECEYAECNNVCCLSGQVCDLQTGECAEPPCLNPSCQGVACGGLDSCDEAECYGDCPLYQACDEVGSGDFECTCDYVTCGDACCAPDEACLDGECKFCDPVANCLGKLCGADDGCGGLCYGICTGLNEYCEQGTGLCLCANEDEPCDGQCCAYGEACVDGVCQLLGYDCEGKACGMPDGVGGFCDGPCPGPDEICVNANCICAFETCGGGCCDEDEVCHDEACCQPVTCAAYGAVECGILEDGCGGLLDCGTCPVAEICGDDLTCVCEFEVCGDACCGEGKICLGGACCAPNCVGKMCGEPDGCSLLCDGPCPGEGEYCLDGECFCGGADCVGKACGADDGCGGVCTTGTCDGDNEICANGTCVCASLEEPCDGVCCAADFICWEDQCLICIPDCEGKMCGDHDGCEYLCDGPCEGENMACTDQFFCDCAGAWCDGTCCPEGNICVEGACCELESCDTVGDFGAECGIHDLGCDTLTSCGDCADQGEYMFCHSEFWTCECEFAECEGECCPDGEVCWAGHGCVPCIPDCATAECGGDDGCGGTCADGTCADPLAVCVAGACECPFVACEGVCCPDGDSCVDGQCDYVCIPDCVGALCGDDSGCGYGCPGNCAGAFEVCVGGACLCEYVACGDGCCAGGEACVGEVCMPCEPQDCGELGAACGFVDDGCGGPLFCGACAPNEVCTDGTCGCAYEVCLGFCCDANETCNGVECESCPSDCSGKLCGEDDGCGMPCHGDCLDDNEICVFGECICEHLDCAGACCAADEFCIFDECVYCVPDCIGKVCGAADGCFGLCDGDCPGENELCQEGVCECNFAECDGTCCAAGEICEAGECTCEYTVCQDTCCAEGDTCLGGECCSPNCDGKLCGAPNGCAGPCIGPCEGANQVCSEGACVCEFVTCGPVCCVQGDICVEGECQPCVGDCTGAVCGQDDGCGQACDGTCLLDNQICDPGVGACYCQFSTCGTACCAEQEACFGGQCVDCIPECDGKMCGDDSGCNYPCDGDCPGPNEVCFGGACQCTDVGCGDACCSPGEECVSGNCCDIQCDGKVCGESDGCGGACQGPCPGEFEVCLEGSCACTYLECFGECCQSGATCANDTCCFPQTCEETGAECGFPSDGCGNVQYCGACADDRYCTEDFTCDCVYDICGDTCCGEGEECVAGVCKIICIPDCSEAECGGSDGCEDICLDGSCSDGNSECLNGVCECLYTTCGDACCSLTGVCFGGVCCEPLECGDVGAACGLIDDGCGGQVNCGNCPDNAWCDGLHQCVCLHEECGGECCGTDEVCDDGACCLPFTCEGLDATCGAPDSGCGAPLDCGECGSNQDCVAFECECVGIECGGDCCDEQVTQCEDGTCGGCNPDCVGKNCGDDDGCGGGGLCDGPCPEPNEVCDWGVCECEFVECDGVCCPETDVCVAGQCEVCVVNCDGKGCGADNECDGLCDGPCGGTYEICTAGVCECIHDPCETACCGPDEGCVDGVCEEICIPDCEGKPCGAPDGCETGEACLSGYCEVENEVCVAGVCECSGVQCAGACCAFNEACEDGECVCIPSCFGKLCGEDDGCGTVCDGPCAGDHEICVDFTCECEFTECAGACCAEAEACQDGQCTCVATCDGKFCGDSDGCSGLCDGPCAVPDLVCVDYQCQCESGLACGGGCCEAGQICVDNECCDPVTCDDFPEVECGVVSDVCGGPLFCGSCGINEWCTEENVCECLYVECEGACCGEVDPCIDGECCQTLQCADQGWECDIHPDGCGGWTDCGGCPANAGCNDLAQCECNWVTCGDVCCAEEYPACVEGKCSGCIPDCDGTCSDDDGCGGFCDGTCTWPNDVCMEGDCICTPDCVGAACGDGDGCGEICPEGACPDPETQSCVSDTCVCNWITCGDVCCGEMEFCEEGVCQPVCVPDCDPEGECGADDGCGEMCDGLCPIPLQVCLWDGNIFECHCPFDECGGACCGEDETCHESSGQCIPCAASCDGKACGDDSGCGYLCNGPCPGPNEICSGGLCSCEFKECVNTCCADAEFCCGTACCTEGYDCEDGVCTVPCSTDCTDKNCGELNECGDSCDGPCPGPNELCQNFVCVCIPDCVGVLCGGSDGCDGLCQGDCLGVNEVCEDAECVCQFVDCEGVCCDEGISCQDGECCIPSCVGAACGDDNGCGGVCDGTCPDLQTCVNFACQCAFLDCAGECCQDGQSCFNAECCTPSCAGAACGDNDGCGGACDGTCPVNMVCQDNQCACQFDTCDLGCCAENEACVAGVCECAPDCEGAVCGDEDGCGDICDGFCPWPNDVCIDGYCVCTPGCVDADCGDDDGCGELCDGPCASPDDVCVEGECICPLDCDGAACGDDDGCGGLCIGFCPWTNDVCVEGSCVCTPDDCIGADCGVEDGCGGFCDGPCPNPATEECVDGHCACLYAQCSDTCCIEGKICNPAGECVDPCTPSCDPAEPCGTSDGCFGTCFGVCTDPLRVCQPEEAVFSCQCLFDECGTSCCEAGETCEAGVCIPCSPSCEGASCGDDSGCGYPCGGPCPGPNEICVDGSCLCQFLICNDSCCAAGEICDAGQCTPCTPSCEGASCGDSSGCGFPCMGPCPDPDEYCNQGMCVCSFDICGDSCCGDDEICDAGQCVPCSPSCEGKDCGDDSGCGYPCTGPCPNPNEVCIFGVCSCEFMFCAGACCAEGETCVQGVCQ